MTNGTELTSTNALMIGLAWLIVTTVIGSIIGVVVKWIISRFFKGWEKYDAEKEAHIKEWRTKYEAKQEEIQEAVNETEKDVIVIDGKINVINTNLAMIKDDVGECKVDLDKIKSSRKGKK